MNSGQRRAKPAANSKAWRPGARRWCGGADGGGDVPATAANVMARRDARALPAQAQTPGGNA